LPTYPFERQRYWLEAPVVGEVAALPAAGQEAEPVARESAGASTSPASAQDATLTEVVDVLQDLSGMDRDALDPPAIIFGFRF
jgi:acyl transferase domain-containing protein